MRCQACNAILQAHEGKWDEERGEHESLCSKCLGSAFQAAEEDNDVDLGEYHDGGC